MRDRRWLRHAARRLLSAAPALLWVGGCGSEPIGPVTGAVEITTSTMGVEPDTDGYTVLLNGAQVRPIGAAETARLDDLDPGVHLVGLTDIASNCQLEGRNFRVVTIVAGDIAAESFTVVCADTPPEPGTLRVTTSTSGLSSDPDGYAVTLDGDAGRPIGASASISIPDLSPGERLVGLTGVAVNCDVPGDNPRIATIPAGGTAGVDFAVTCAATTGALALDISGLPNGTDAAVAVAGPGGYLEQVIGPDTLIALAPGDYTVTAASVASGGVSYGPTPAERIVAVAAGDTASATVRYEPLPTLNLTIAGLYLTQSTQTFTRTVPLVAGRDAFVRVFVQANEANAVSPVVRVRFYHNASLTESYAINPPGGSTPLVVDEGALTSSWNVTVPGSLVRPGLRIQAEVDPSGVIRESDESDNRFPASGGPGALDVRTTPVVALTLVPVGQSANGLVGDLNAANVNQYIDLARRIYPVTDFDVQVHEVLVTAGPLQPDDGNGAWGVLLDQIDALRVAEGTGRLYYGVVKLDYTGGQVARSVVGLPVAVGFDNVSQRARMAAHELGHMWGRMHAPCGENTQDIDPGFPYPGGQIGRYGFDVQAGVLKEVTTPDIMGLCQNAWISDYTYVRILEARGTATLSASRAGGARPWSGLQIETLPLGPVR